MTEQQLEKANRLRKEIEDLKFFLKRVEEGKRLFLKTKKKDYKICADAFRPFTFNITDKLRDGVTDLLKVHLKRLEKELGEI